MDEKQIKSKPKKGKITKIQKLEEELLTEKAAKLQAMADLQNFRRRTEEEKAKFGAMANMLIISQLLEIIDDIQFAKSDAEMDLTRSKEVIGLLESKLELTINAAGIEKVEIKEGDKFDSSSMEAVTTAPGTKKDTVVNVISAAYKYKSSDELLKSAKVVVGGS